MQFFGALLDALVPPLCVLCRGEPGPMPWLCTVCAERLELIAEARCFRCGAPRPIPAPLCARCPDFPRRFGALRSAALHRGTARELANALQYGEVLAAAQALGHLTVAAARLLPVSRDGHALPVVVPVPLFGRRSFGCDSAAELARVVAARLSCPCRPRWLRRIRPESGVVHRTKSGRERETRGAFRARPEVAGRQILLVDLTVRTGATMASCSRALFRRGAAGVWGASATRAL